LLENATSFREQMSASGFELIPGEHPIIPVMLHDARRAQAMSAAMLEEGVLVAGFSFPVVPTGQARVRTQVSAAHTSAQIDAAVRAFSKVGRWMGLI
jgi:glycine C-acetyltransferase